MDPEKAARRMREIIKALRAAEKIKEWPPGYADELRELRDEGWDIIDDLGAWVRRGGFAPRGYRQLWPDFYSALDNIGVSYGGIGFYRSR